MWNTYISLMARTEAKNAVLSEEEPLSAEEDAMRAAETQGQRAEHSTPGLFPLDEVSEHSRTSSEFGRIESWGSLRDRLSEDRLTTKWPSPAQAGVAAAQAGAAAAHCAHLPADTSDGSSARASASRTTSVAPPPTTTSTAHAIAVRVDAAPISPGAGRDGGGSSSGGGGGGGRGSGSLREMQFLLSPTKTMATNSPSARPPTLVIGVSSQNPTSPSYRAKISAKCLAPVKSGSWTCNLLLGSPTRMSPTRVSGAGGHTGGLQAATHRGQTVALDEHAQGAAAAAGGGVTRSRVASRVTLSISVSVPRYPMEGRVSTPTPEAWRRRRVRCRMGAAGGAGLATILQERYARSTSLPERPFEVSSPGGGGGRGGM